VKRWGARGGTEGWLDVSNRRRIEGGGKNKGVADSKKENEAVRDE